MTRNKRGPTTAKEVFEINLCLLIEREIKRRKIGRDNVLRSVSSLLTGLSHHPAVSFRMVRDDWRVKK